MIENETNELRTTTIFAAVVSPAGNADSIPFPAFLSQKLDSSVLRGEHTNQPMQSNVNQVH